MARKLLDTVQQLEAQEEKKEEPKKAAERNGAKRAVEKIVSREGAKDKQISAKVNRNMYHVFTKINRAQGLSNNSALNMIIAKYVRENKELLDEEMIV